MKNNFLRHATLLGASLLLALPMAAQAHRQFLLPSETMASNAGATITFDASASEELFNFDHSIALDNIVIDGPKGATATPENLVKGKQRSSFELTLPQEGSYRIALINDNLSAMYKVNGDRKRWRGNAAAFAKEVPADAQDLNVMHMQGRVETYVTVGKPDAQTWKTSGQGLELEPLTGVTENFVGDTDLFRFLLNGKPAADLTVTVIRGGTRYRDALGEITLKTDKDGKFSIKWPNAGMYWINANVGKRPPPGVVGTLEKPISRISYNGTLEVLQP
jgi:uncharacterized GH25 family protein